MAKHEKEIRESRIEKRESYLHIETEGCIVNIYPCLKKDDGRPCTTVTVLPDNYADEKYEFDEGTGFCRVVKVK